MSTDRDIGRLNVLLEWLSECSVSQSREELIRMAGGRIRWVIEFDRLTLALGDETRCTYWSVTRQQESFISQRLEDVPPLHASLIQRALQTRAPVAAVPATAICNPLATNGVLLGAICLSDEKGRYDYRDLRFAHHIAQTLAGTLARLDNALVAQRKSAELVEAETTNRSKDLFLAMLGHELRNPLAPILTATTLLRRKLGTECEAEVGTIERQAKHMVRLVDDLLDVARLTRGKVVLQRAPVDLAVAVTRALEIAMPLIEANGHALHVDVPSQLWVDADDARLAQVIANLVTNSARYTPHGGRIEVRASADDRDVRLEVVDNGRGLAAKLIPTVFDQFVQGEMSAERAGGGLGLGLAIVKSLVELHGGTVAAVSAGEGQGSTFSFTLRRIAAPPSTRAPESPRASGESRRILIVDDNVDGADMLAAALAYEGHVVTALYDPVAVMALHDDVRPDIAILDIGLPVIDGCELARSMRERWGTSTPHLIALSGYGQPSDLKRTQEAGFALHLVKPVNIAALIRAIDAYETERAKIMR